MLFELDGEQVECDFKVVPVIGSVIVHQEKEYKVGSVIYNLDVGDVVVKCQSDSMSGGAVWARKKTRS